MRHGRHHHPPGRRRLFWRVYLNGLFMLAIAFLVAAGVTSLTGRGPFSFMREYQDRLAAHLAARAADIASDVPRIESDLRRERDLRGAELSIYKIDGTLVASSIRPPVSPLTAEELSRLSSAKWQWIGRHWVVPLRDGETAVAYAVGLPFHGSAPVGRFALGLAAILFAIAIGSVPLARAITSPLERLTATARALGEGDLGVRTGLRRRDEVGELASAFDEMAERLEQLVRGEKELLANVSHELRTPLARIHVALDLAAEGDGERARRALGEIGGDLAELEKLVEDVLTAAKLDLASHKAGDAAPPLRKQRIDPAEMLERAAERFRSAFPGRILEVQVKTPLPAIDADATLLRRVVDNLLDNARKYSDDHQPVTLTAEGREGRLFIEVRDRGIGVDAADVPRLFTPFFRTDRSRGRGTGGVGLGLALARRIVVAHGGTVGVESVAGEGSVFRVAIPAAS